MKLFIALAAVVLLSLSAAPLQAQTTGPAVINQIRAHLEKSQSFTVRLGEQNRMSLLDAGSGSEIVWLEEVDAQQVTLGGTVVRISDLTPQQQSRVRARIAFFNFSSPVGTLTLNEGTGVVTMEHHLNPRLVPVPAMADAARIFAQVARSQSRSLLQ